ncbi:HdeD family acid-resistance protein [Nonomuraea sp. NPDC050310]|uniref:HdeD family acid-resistance protein n=1 Tax=unclassified Nonomuraea TaxID=2593643 RepID=UPI0033FE1825
MLLIRGIIAIIFGIMAMIWPGITLWVLVLFFGAYALVDGVFALFAGFQQPKGSKAWLITMGVLGILAGIVAFVWPGMTTLVLLYVIAFWAIFTGITQIVAGVRLRKTITNEWLLILSGVLGVIFGILLVIWPGAGALAMIWLIAVFAILYGITLCVLAFKVKSLAK